MAALELTYFPQNGSRVRLNYSATARHNDLRLPPEGEV